jgi:hypothetical protein
VNKSTSTFVWRSYGIWQAFTTLVVLIVSFVGDVGLLNMLVIYGALSLCNGAAFFGAYFIMYGEDDADE